MIQNRKFTLDFIDKNILITGSSKGIGKELARGFSELGAKVIIHGRDLQVLQALAKEIDCKYIVADLSVHDEVERMISEILAMNIKLNILINNAGIEIAKPFEEFSMEEYDEIQNVNVRSVVHITKGLFPIIEKNSDSSLINMSSIHQLLPYPTNLPYCMSKAAMEMFSKVLAVEWAPYKIRVNTVAPGAILTEMNKKQIENIGYGVFQSWIASGKIGSVKEVLSACIYIASDMSSYMTGETIYIDGALSKGLLPYGITPAMQTMKEKLQFQKK